jgi:hypothetical protein
VTLLAPDVDIAVELVRRAEVDSWGSLTEDLMRAAPRIHQSNAERADDLVAWLAPYADAQPSMVQAAVASFARLLADFLLVLHYDLEIDSPLLRVPKWYRQEPRSVRAHEEWHIHVTLLYNLTVELTRAINLVIARAQQADPGALQRRTLAVCDCGPAHAPLRAVTYTAEQSEQAQPYPGLAGFPSVVADRTVGDLGVREGDVPRTAAEFERWIANLIERRGACSEPPPASAGLPLALPKPPRSEDTEGVPPVLTIVSAIVAFCAAVGGVLVYPWLAGAAIVLVAVAVVFRRRLWRWPASPPAVLVFVIAGCLGGAIGELAAAAFDGTDKTPLHGAPLRPSSSANYRPVGQIEQGAFFRGGDGPVAAFTDPVSVLVGGELRLGVRLVNGGPDDIPQAIVQVTVPNVAASSEGVTVTVRSEEMRPSEVADTMTVNIDANRSACLRYISGSTQFLDSRHGLVRSLPDGVIGSGVAVGPLGLVLSNGTRYVVFSVRAVGLASGSRCS